MMDVSDVQLYGDTILFLTQEGFICYEYRVENKSFSGLVLTAKGLAALNVVPDVLQESSTIGQRLSQAAKEGSKEMLSALINQLIQISVNGFIKSQVGF